MDHTLRLSNRERLERIESRLRLLSHLAAGRHEGVPPPDVWQGLHIELEELAAELHEVSDGLPLDAQDALPVTPAPWRPPTPST
jgi:hypothetical protein